jgi:hypothetical protein
MKLPKLLATALLAAALPCAALAQTSPGWGYKFVPTPAQWNAAFAGKQDYLGAPPLLTTGGVMTGPLVTAPSTTALAGFNLPPGTAPTSPNNGDLWSTASGLFAELNGATVNLTGASSASFGNTSPITVSFPGGVVTYACATCAVTGNPLSQFAATTSAQLAGVISNETGTGLLVFNNGASMSSLTVTTAFTATGLVTNADLANSTISGVALGANLATLTFGTHLASGGTSYNGSTAITITPDATNLNTASTMVARDSSGNFAAGTITAALTGHASLDLALSSLGTNVQTALGNALNGANGLVGFSGNIGAASGTSLALGGCAIGSNALCVTGTLAFPNNSLTLAEFPTIGANTVLGTNVGGTPLALTSSQLTTLCNTFSVSLNGCVPNPGSATGKVLSDNGTWIAVGGAGTVTSAQVSAGPGIIVSGTCTITTSGNCTVSTSTIPSRAIAITQNLSVFSSIQTQGYAAAGDGGGATFLNVGSANFIDSQVTGSTITVGSGCTNGTYYGVRLTGGHGQNLIAVVTVASGAVSAVNYTYSPGNAYSVTDVLAIPSATITCSNASITVTSVSTPLGSFSDSAGNHWQIVNNGIVYASQFGAFPSVADDFTNLQAGLFFTNYTTNNSIGGGGYWGGRFFLSNGAYAICGSSGALSLEVPQGVIFEMASNQAASINTCSGWNASVPVVVLCDPNWQFTCFGAMTLHFSVYVPRTASPASNVPVIYSNNTQDFGGVYDTYIYGGLRQCLAYEKGYGGASTFTLDHLSCSTDSNSVQVRIGSSTSAINVGSTAVRFIAPVLGGSSSGGTYQAASGIIIYGGYVQIESGHAEQMPTGIEVNNSAAIANGMVWIKNFNAGSSAPAPTCTGVIQLDGSNTPGNTVIEMTPASGSCTNTISNGQSGGTSFTGNAVKPITCVSGACS